MPPLSRRQVKDLASLTRRKGRKALGQFLVEGVRSVEAAVEGEAPLVLVAATEEALADGRTQEAVRRAGVPVYTVSASDLARLGDVQTAQGVVAVSEAVVQNADALASVRTVVVLDGVQDPGNVGTLIRTAAWFGADALLAGPGTADPESPKVVRAAMGGLWDLALVRLPDDNSYRTALDGLRARGLPLVGADLEGERAAAWTPPEAGALVLGSEAHGLSAAVSERLTGRVRLAGGGRGQGVESLNVAVAGGILLHRWLGS